MEHWQALTPFDFVNKGRTHPFRVRCERYNSETHEFETGDFLLKAPRRGVIESEEFFREVAGLRVARHFGIPTARVAIIELDDEFVKSLEGTPFGEHKFEAGIGVGCEFVTGLTTLSARTRFREEWSAHAWLIYAFDLLMANDDRTVANANCGFKQKQLLAYDFERILSGGEQPAWQVCDHDFVANHIFHSHLMGKKGQWDEFLEQLESLSDEFLRGQISDLPPSWNTAARQEKLLRHIREARSQTLKLRNELDKCLLKPLPATGGENS